MFCLRTFTRSAPRVISQSVIPYSALRPLSTVQRASFLSSLKPSSRSTYAAFSTSTTLKKPAGDGDIELIAKMDEELSHEKASGLNDLSAAVKNIEAVLGASTWEIKDIPGEQEVVLSKKFGSEKICLNFSIADVRNLSEQDDLFDNALADEADFQEEAAGQNRSASNGAPAEDREADGMDLDAETDFPARVNITIEKPGGGALLIQTVVQNGFFQIEDLSYFANPDLAHAQTAEKDWARQALYTGPPFGNLDEALQGLLDRYLEERGINSELATMIPDYIQVKEQKEYVSWLENIKNFVSA